MASILTRTWKIHGSIPKFTCNKGVMITRHYFHRQKISSKLRDMTTEPTNLCGTTYLDSDVERLQAEIKYKLVHVCALTSLRD